MLWILLCVFALGVGSEAKNVCRMPKSWKTWARTLDPLFRSLKVLCSLDSMILVIKIASTNGQHRMPRPTITNWSSPGHPPSVNNYLQDNAPEHFSANMKISSWLCRRYAFLSNGSFSCRPGLLLDTASGLNHGRREISVNIHATAEMRNHYLWTPYVRSALSDQWTSPRLSLDQTALLSDAWRITDSSWMGEARYGRHTNRSHLHVYFP